jgi:hypothetical protein
VTPRSRAIEGLAALWWLDFTAFLHRLRHILREPKRLWTWAFFVIWLVMVAAGRILGGRQAQNSLGFAAAGPVVGALIPAAFILILGLVWQAAARRAPAALSSPADGHFLLSSDIPPRVVVLWLQLRQAWGLSRAVLLNAVIWLAILLPSAGVTIPGVLKGMLAILLAALLLYGIRLPLFVLSRRHPRLPVAAAGIAIAVIAGAALLDQVYRAVGTPGNFAAALTRDRVALPVGATVASAVGGNWGALLLLLVLAVLVTALSVYVAQDCYPEIWESSNRAFAVRRLARRGRFGGADLRSALSEAGAPVRKRARAAVISSQGGRVPGGSWVLLWKEWLAFRRSAGGLRVAGAWLLGAAIAGALVGEFALRQGGPGVEGVIVGFAIYPALFLSTASGISLAADIRRPIWWLSDEPLIARIAVWTVATSVKGIALITVGLIAASMTSNTLATTMAAVPLAAAAVWLLRVIGLTVYSLMPSQTDLRGPGAALRLLVTFVLLFPAAAVAGAFGAVAGSGTVAFVAGTLAAIGEGILLLVFASSRLRGNGLAVAQAEQR